MENECKKAAITMYVPDDVEVLKICNDGSFYVRGKKIKEDIEVYNAFVKFLTEGGYYGKS